MRKSLLIFFVVLTQSFFGLSQTAFNRHYDADSTLDAVFCGFQTFDKGYIIAGNWYNSSLGISGALIIRTNCNGDTIWKKIFDFSSTGGDDFEYGFQDTDSNFVMTGYFQDTVLLKKDAFICKLDKYGMSCPKIRLQVNI